MRILSDVGNYWWAFIVGAILIFALCFIMYKARNKSLEEKELIDAKEKIIDNGHMWVVALGNKENISDVSANGSRLVAELKNVKHIDKEMLKALGVANIVEMSSKVTLVLEHNAAAVAEAIKKEI